MKKILLLTILLVVAASAAITFDPAPPSKVGESVTAFIPLTSYLLYVVEDGTPNTWVIPLDGSGNIPVTITHPGTGLILKAVGASTEESAPFDVVIGDEVRWQVIAEGETGVEGDATEPDGKSGTASVTAGTDYTFDINLCDIWFNITDSNPTGYTIDSDDQYDVISGNSVQLRSEGLHAVWVSGGSYTPDTSFVTVEAGDATRLLLVCGGEKREPGDTRTTGGKTGTPNDAYLEQDYEIDVYAVDNAWNQDKDYNGGIVTIFDSDGSPIGTSDTEIAGGYVKVTVNYQKINTSGEYTSATETGGLSTSYDTEVDVYPEITSVEAVLDPSTTNPGVIVSLSATAKYGENYADDIDLFNSCLGLGTGSCANLTLPETMETNDNGLASCQVSASDTGTYYIEVSAGTVADTVVLTIQELEGLVVQPNPFKNSMHTLPIDFRYKVEQVGVGGASEVYILIADPFGNTVYTASYDINDVQTNPGEQTIQWNGANSSGNTVASGMYQAVVKITLINGSTSVIKKNFMLIW